MFDMLTRKVPDEEMNSAYRLLDKALCCTVAIAALLSGLTIQHNIKTRWSGIVCSYTVPVNKKKKGSGLTGCLFVSTGYGGISL